MNEAYTNWLKQKFNETPETARLGRMKDFAKAIGMNPQDLSHRLTVNSSKVAVESLRRDGSLGAAVVIARQLSEKAQSC